LKRLTLVIIAAGLLVAAGLGVAFVPQLISGNNPTYNVVQVYVSSWHTNESVDVVFKISIDLNNDGEFEFPKTSEVFNNTSILVSPFKMGGPLVNSVAHFKYKVEVFEVVNNEWVPMPYTEDGSIPVYEGNNTVYATGYGGGDATSLPQHSVYACGLSFYYVVS